jgi:hypothetical protein
MTIARRRLVRLIETRAGCRYLVQVPRDPCPVPGWRTYALLALSLNGDDPVRLTLYERTDDGPGNSDDPRAA